MKKRPEQAEPKKVGQKQSTRSGSNKVRSYWMLFYIFDYTKTFGDQLVRELIKDVWGWWLERHQEPEKKNEGKTKPINLVLFSGHDRYKLVKYLVNLRGKPQYKKISTTEDYTVFERSKIRDWAKKS